MHLQDCCCCCRRRRRLSHRSDAVAALPVAVEAIKTLDTHHRRLVAELGRGTAFSCRNRRAQAGMDRREMTDRYGWPILSEPGVENHGIRHPVRRRAAEERGR